MSIDEKILERFGRDMADDLGTGTPPDLLNRCEQAFVSLAVSGLPVGRRRNLRIALASAAVLAALVCASLFWTKADTMSFRIGKGRVVQERNVWVQAAVGETLPIYFEDGSELSLLDDAAIRIVKSDMDGVDIDLTRGVLKGNIKSAGKTRWTMHAGPYCVTVLGTVFALDWKTKSLTLDVNVTKGVVLVQGNGLNDHGIKVAAGNHLRANGQIGLVSLNLKNSVSAVADVAEESLDAGRLDVADSIEPAATQREIDSEQRPVRRAAAPENDWKQLYEQERYLQALEAAEKAGLDELIASSTKQDLWRLADAARNAGQAELAGEILMAFRRRFGGSPKAQIAAFLLGRIAAEQKNDPDDAVKWFDTYLRESPNGPLAEEALGRLMVIYHEAGRAREAKNTAEKYLSLYTNGSFAKLAYHVTSY